MRQRKVDTGFGHSTDDVEMEIAEPTCVPAIGGAVTEWPASAASEPELSMAAVVPESPLPAKAGPSSGWPLAPAALARAAAARRAGGAAFGAPHAPLSEPGAPEAGESIPIQNNGTEENNKRGDNRNRSVYGNR